MAKTNSERLQEIAQEQIQHAIVVSNLKNEVSDVKTELSIVKVGVSRILHILDNDDKTGDKGLVFQVRQNSTFVKNSKAIMGFLAIISTSMVALSLWILDRIKI